jgi:hypothetical protein
VNFLWKNLDKILIFFSKNESLLQICKRNVEKNWCPLVCQCRSLFLFSIQIPDQDKLNGAEFWRSGEKTNVSGGVQTSPKCFGG